MNQPEPRSPRRAKRLVMLGTLLAAFFAAFATLGCDPIIMIPGGALAGDVAPTPLDWSFTDAVDTVQLETRPSDPYSVNIWAVAADGGLFVVAGGGAESTWATHIAEDDRVRLRVGDSIFELRAAPDTSDGARAAFLEAAKKKYDFDPEGEDTEKAILYRMSAR